MHFVLFVFLCMAAPALAFVTTGSGTLPILFLQTHGAGGDCGLWHGASCRRQPW